MNNRFCLDKLDESSLIHVDTLFVGGGPATLCTIANYIKSGKINILLGERPVDLTNNLRQKDEKSKNKSFCIIESTSSFGGGALLDYGIRSNTSAKGFIKVIWKQNIKPKGDETLVDKLQKSKFDKITENRDSWSK